MIPFYESNSQNIRSFLNNGMTFPLHLHQQLEIIYVHSGTQSVKILDCIEILGEGDIAVIFPNCIHEYESPTKNSSIQLIICDLRFTGNFKDKLAKSHPTNPFIKRKLLSDNIRFALEELDKECGKTKDLAVCSALIQLILARCFPFFELVSTKDYFVSDYASQMAQYINRNFTSQITLDNLAGHLGLNRYHVSHLFSDIFKVSFPKYLNSLRINEAISRMNSSDDSLLQICLDSGFNSQRTFNRVFKEMYQMTPREYIKLMDE